VLARTTILFPLMLIVGLWSGAEAASPVDDLAVTAEIPGNDTGFDFAAIDPAARILYVARDDGVMSVDLETKKVTPILVPGDKVHAVVPLPNGRLLSTNGGSNTATLSDGRTGLRIAELPTGQEPDAAAFDPQSGLVFVMDAGSGDITLIDPLAGVTIGHIPIGGTLEAAVADGQGRLYITIEDKGEVAVLDTVQLKLIAHYPLPGCTGPSGIAYDPASRLILSACKNQKAVALHATDGSISATLDIGRHPDTILFDPIRRMFFVPCAQDPVMIAIAVTGQSLMVVRKIPTAIGARTGALDPSTGAFYLPAADYDITPKGFVQKPGTFRVLVVGPPHA
jgi:DNA-binding beta-propeller fold protein YncE